MNKKEKPGKNFNVSNCNFSLFILVLGILTYVRGMYLKLKTYFSRKNFDVLGLILNYISYEYLRVKKLKDQYLATQLKDYII